MLQELNSRVLQIERTDVKIRGPIIVSVLRENLVGSAFVVEKPFTQDDVQIARRAIILTAPYAHTKVFPSYWEHIVYSSILARHITIKVNSKELEPYEAEALQLMGDDGSIAVPHRYYRKNVVNQLFDNNIGIIPDLVAKQPPIPQILGRGKAVNNIEDLTLPQIILDLADNLGKLNPDGTPFSILQMKRYDETQARRYEGGVFASERFGLRALTERGRQKVAVDLVFAEMELLKDEYSIDVEEICNEAFIEFCSPENQAYVNLLKQIKGTSDPNP